MNNTKKQESHFNPYETFQKISQHMLSMGDKEARSDAFYEYFMEKQDLLNGKSKIYFSLLCPLEQALAVAITDSLNIPRDSSDKYAEILMNYDFYQNSVSKIIEIKYGSLCCVDQASVIIYEYLNFLRTTKIRHDLRRIHNDYAIPKDYDPGKWFLFIRSLYSLRLGNFKIYLEALQFFFPLPKDMLPKQTP